MRMPASLMGLADYGLIDEVVRPLMSGKEAQIYLVVSQGELRVAKVYREAEHRNFKHRAEYKEGRSTRNSRDQRAMAKRSRYGRQQDEAAWRATEVDMIYRLNDAGVRVPRPYQFVDGVLIMELVADEEGQPAPRLGDVHLDPQRAAEIYEQLLREVIRMLSAGVVHGDLSDFNVLLDATGPVIIDFPQAVDASANASARKLLTRDVDNLHRFAQRHIPGLRPRPYGQEMWELYQRGELQPDTVLRGQFKAPAHRVNTDDVLDLVREASEDAARQDPARRRPPAAPSGAVYRAVDTDLAPAGPGPRRLVEVAVSPSRGSRQAHAGARGRGGRQRSRDAQPATRAQGGPHGDARRGAPQGGQLGRQPDRHGQAGRSGQPTKALRSAPMGPQRTPPSAERAGMPPRDLDQGADAHGGQRGGARRRRRRRRKSGGGTGPEQALQASRPQPTDPPKAGREPSDKPARSPSESPAAAPATRTGGQASVNPPPSAANTAGTTEPGSRRRRRRKRRSSQSAV